MSWFKLILTSCYICNDTSTTLSDIQHFVYIKDIAEDMYSEHGVNSLETLLSGVITIIVFFGSILS